jgi:polyisoprenoid-binding protein YceI
MLRTRIVCILAALLSGAVVPPLAADTLTFELDPAATTIEFGFGATLHHVDGTLRVKEGKIELDPATGSASGRIVIDATSAKTGNSRRDGKMHAKILESPRYPEMIFTVERVTGAIHLTGRSEMELHGTLDMHGARHPIDLLATARAGGDRGDRITATGHVTIPYRDWGMADPSFFILRVEKEVHVQVKAVGRLTGGAPPAAPSVQ